MALYHRDYMRGPAESELTSLWRFARRNLASTFTALILFGAVIYAIIMRNPNAELRDFLAQEYGEARADDMVAELSYEERQMMTKFARMARQFAGR